MKKSPKKNTKHFEWRKRIDNREEKCFNCSATENLTVDHIIPIAILMPLYIDSSQERYDMLYNDEENFQILCRYCNFKKSGKLDIRNPKTSPLLERLVETLKNKS